MPKTTTTTDVLFFGEANAKLKHLPLKTFTIPAGTTCPGACACLSKFDRNLRKIVDGPETQYRCFAASAEASRTSVRMSTDNNLSKLKKARTRRGMADLIRRSLPPRFFKIIRVHVGGDFFSESYFLAWTDVARQEPGYLFYAYTKSLPFWVKHLDAIPDNMVLTASRGGKFDRMITEHGLRSERVVGHPEEAAMLGLEVDHDDSHARNPDCPAFALLVHGTQPKGSHAAKSKSRMDAEEISYSYGRGTNG